MRIVIGEDSALFREGLRGCSRTPATTSWRRAATPTDLVRAVDAQLPDLAIIDIRMPPDNTDDGARAAARLRDSHPELGIVLLSQHVESHHSVGSHQLGRFGYLLKDRRWTSTTSSTRIERVAARRLRPRPRGGRPAAPSARAPDPSSAHDP